MKTHLEIDSFKTNENEILQQIVELSDFIPFSDADSLKNSSLHCLRSVWESNLRSKDNVIFFCKLISQTIDTYLSKEYTFFDAHTATNCCHGIALLARNLVLEISEINLHTFKKLAEEKIEELEKHSKISSFCTNWVPKPLIKLLSLYLLATTRTIAKGRQKTDPRSLKEISPIGSTFCWKITNSLQKSISNLVAHRYRSYLAQICPHTDINGAPIHFWGNYIQPEHIRTDKTNKDYVSCVFSTQVSLAYLVKTKAKIALVNDIIGSSGELRGRYVRIFEGDGKNSFKVLSESTNLLSLDESEPVIVFAGYVYSDNLTLEELSCCMSPWLDEFPRLMLACDVFYPQFPRVCDDPNFDNSPIHPEEDILKEIFSFHKEIPGVSATDPSLFCSSHTYLSSLKQIAKTVQNNDLSALPPCIHGVHPLSQVKKNDL